VSRRREQYESGPNEADLVRIITDPNSAELLVREADNLGQNLKQAGLATNQIRALFGEVRQIQGEWTVEGRRTYALRKLILLKPKMAYRARRERGRAVRMLVEVLEPAVNIVTQAPSKETAAGSSNNQDDNFQRFVDFFEAILAYHKSYGGN